jgi:protein O-mannosyl-transferase
MIGPHPRYKIFALAIVMITRFLLYIPAVNGPYLVDDFPNLIQNDHLLLEKINPEQLGNAAMSSHTGFPGRPLSMLSFSLNYTLAGDKDPFPVKLTNILLHLLTGFAIFVLLKRLLQHWIPHNNEHVFWTALFTTTLWLVHPLQVSTVLYAVQRMTQLSALFTVLGLIAYMKYRQITIQTNSQLPTLLLTVAGLGILGVLSKENAVLLPVFALLIEVTVFRFAFHPHASNTSKILLRSFLYIPLSILFAYLIFVYVQHGAAVIWPYAYTIEQRVLTEARVLMHYLGWITLVNPEPLSIYHTDLKLSTGLFNPATTLISILVLISLLAAALLSLYKQVYPVLGFGLLWFFIGQLLESTTVPLELIFEHRNYLPAAGMLLIPAYFLVHTLANHTKLSRQVLFSCLILLVTVFLSHDRINSWRDEKGFILELIKTKGDVSWTWAQAASYLTRAGNYINAIESIRTAARLSPSEPAFIFGEAYIRCQLQPTAEFPGEFKATLRLALHDRPVTPTSVNSFVSMIKMCQQTNSNDVVLRELYIEAGKYNMDIMANIGKQALDRLDNKPVQE